MFRNRNVTQSPNAETPTEFDEHEFAADVKKLEDLLAESKAVLDRIAAQSANTESNSAQQPVIGSPLCAAKALYAMRRQRTLLFASSELFGEPAWDILLDLFIARQEGKRVPVTSACIGAAVPPTTGLRWLALLESTGMVKREDDPKDARRSFVSISERAENAVAQAMTELLRAIARPAVLSRPPAARTPKPRRNAPHRPALPRCG